MYAETKKNRNNFFKTSYQYSHYYENEPKIEPTRDETKKENIRPDLYVYDPIINEKISIHKRTYIPIKWQGKREVYGKLNMSEKDTLKYLFDEYQSRPPKRLKYNVSSTGYDYRDSAERAKPKLLQKICTDQSPIEINDNFNSKHCEFLQPYISTTHLSFPDFTDRLETVRNDIITCYNKRAKKKESPKCTVDVCYLKRRQNMTVPFFGDTSVYKASYKSPTEMTNFLDEVCVVPEFLETLKIDTKAIPQMYDTEQKQTGSGKPIRVPL